MQIDLESLRRHYSSLSDEELLALNRDDLIEMAQKCWDEEVERRGLACLSQFGGPTAGKPLRISRGV